MRAFIIEEHTEALEVLSLGVRRGLIEVGKCSMVHFDSHPDLSCFDNILPEHIRDRTELCHRLRNSEDGISSFILPSLSMRLLKDVVWVKPPWTEQIPAGHHRLTFGWTKSDDSVRMAIATDLDYWKGDGHSVSDVAELQNSTTFDLCVTEIARWANHSDSAVVEDRNTDEKAYKRPRVDSSSVSSNQGTSQWVLDICLDYFSCANPLQEPDLPEHISTAEEIASMLQALQKALEWHMHSGLRSPPAFCIIARSEQDGFTPEVVCGNLEASVLEVLRNVYGEVKVLRVPTHEVFYDPQFIRSV
jgi:hypothetical protein